MIRYGTLLVSDGYETCNNSGLAKSHLQSSPITCMDMASSGQLLVVGRFNGCISFYRIKSSTSTRPRTELLLNMAPAHSDKTLQAAVTTLAFSPCLRFLAVGTIKGAVSVIDMRIDNIENLNSPDDQCFQLLYTHHEHQQCPITALCWSRFTTAQKLYSGCQGGKVYELDWKPSSVAFSSFASLQITKPTTMVCACAHPVARIESSTLDAADLGGLLDIIVVSAQKQTMIFQFPLDPSFPPRCRDLDSSNMTRAQRGRRGSNQSYTATCFSNSIDDGNGPPNPTVSNCGMTLASGMLSVRGSAFQTAGDVQDENSRPAPHTCLQVRFLDVDGNLQQAFDLDPIVGKQEQPSATFFSCRQLVNFNCNAYKHLLIAISSCNHLHLVNLQQMSAQCLDEYMSSFDNIIPREILAVSAAAGRLAVMTQTLVGGSSSIAIELFECLSPTSMTLPLMIVPSSFYTALCRLQGRCRSRAIHGREAQQERSIGAARLGDGNHKRTRATFTFPNAGNESGDAYLLHAIEVKTNQDAGRKQLKMLVQTDAAVQRQMEDLLAVLGEAVNTTGMEQEDLGISAEFITDESSSEQLCRPNQAKVLSDSVRTIADGLLFVSPADGDDEGKGCIEWGEEEGKGHTSDSNTDTCSLDANSAFLQSVDRTINSSSHLLELPEANPDNLLGKYSSEGKDESIDSLLSAADSMIAASNSAISNLSPRLFTSSSKLPNDPLPPEAFQSVTPLRSQADLKLVQSGDDDDEEEQDFSWLRDNGGSWLDKWWDSPSAGSELSVRARLNGKRQGTRALTQISTTELPSVPPCFCGTKNTYHVLLRAPRGIGLSLATTISQPMSLTALNQEQPSEPLTALLESLPASTFPPNSNERGVATLGTGSLLVRGFYDLPGGEASPARLCGMIAVGDILVGIDETSLEMDGEQAGVDGHELLRRIDRSKADVLLHFRFGDVPRWMQRECSIADQDACFDERIRPGNMSSAPISSEKYVQRGNGIVDRSNAQLWGVSNHEQSYDAETHWEKADVQFLGTMDELITLPVASAAAAVLPLAQYGIAQLAELTLGVSGSSGEPVSALTLASKGMSAMTHPSERPSEVQPPKIHPKYNPIHAVQMHHPERGGRAIRNVEAFLGLQGARKAPQKSDSEFIRDLISQTHKYPLAAPSSCLSGHALTESQLSDLAEQIRDADWSTSSSSMQCSNFNQRGAGVGMVWKLDSQAGFFSSGSFSKLVRSRVVRADCRLSTLSRSSRSKQRVHSRSDQRDLAENSKRVLLSKRVEQMVQRCLMKVPDEKCLHTESHAEPPEKVDVHMHSEGEASQQPEALFNSNWAGLQPLRLKFHSKDSSSCEDKQWTALHRKRHVQALVVLVHLKQQSLHDANEHDQLQVAQHSILELLQQARSARLKGLSKVSTKSAGSVSVTIKQHFPPVALTMQLALLVRLQLQQTVRLSPLDLLLAEWTALLTPITSTDPPLLANLHAAYERENYLPIAPTTLQALGFFTGAVPEVLDYLALTKTLVTLRCLFKCCSPLLRISEEMHAIGSLPVGLINIDGTRSSLIIQSDREQWDDAETAAFIAANSTHLYIAPLLLAVNAMQLASASSTLSSLVLASALEAPILTISNEILRAVQATSEVALLGTFSSATNGEQLIAKTLSSCGYKYVYGYRFGFTNRDREIGTDKGLFDLLPLAVQRLLPTLCAITNPYALHLVAEIAATCFPSIQPWNFRLALFGCGVNLVSMDMQSLNASPDLREAKCAQETYHHYLTCIFRTPMQCLDKSDLQPLLSSRMLAEVHEWLYLSLLLRKGESMISDILSMHLPSDALLQASSLCLAMEDIAAAISGCRRFLSLRLRDLSENEASQTFSVLRACFETSFFVAADCFGSSPVHFDRCASSLRLIWVLIVGRGVEGTKNSVAAAEEAIVKIGDMLSCVVAPLISARQTSEVQYKSLGTITYKLLNKSLGSELAVLLVHRLPAVVPAITIDIL